VTTTYTYSAQGYPSSVTEGAAAVGSTPALNLTTTCSNFDAFADAQTVVDPRGNATTFTFDNMRRKTLEENRNGGATALPLMEKTFVYDANGRLTTENRATGFNGSGVPTGWQTWLTSYTPTGKTAVATDPLGNATFTIYDALDRVSQVIDASGRVTQKTYDLAGQELTEVRGFGSPSPVTWATYTWSLDGEKLSVEDANANVTNLAYDGFNRLAAITYPDDSTETNQYDPDDDLIIWTNRGGYGVVRCYDVLNRKVSETGITGATVSGACATGGTTNLTTRSWDMQPRTFAYDLAGRLTSADNSNLTMTWAYDAAGRATGRGGNWSTSYVWDAASNMTSVTYPDGSVFTYAYDALNRTSAALQGTTTLASLAYDALGRRSVLSFGDSSSQTWGYDNADRVTSLAHAFPTTSGDVTLTYGYDAADREMSRTTSNAAYQWSPAVTSVSYTGANKLNQYPSVNAYAYSYWPEGPLEENDQLEGRYDETNQMMFMYITVTPGTIDPNNWEENGADALGHLFFHERHPAAGVAYPEFYHSTDGLRPENVLDWQYTQPVSGGAVFQGYRRYVLGPAPDERWAFLDFDGSTYYPHTDRDGTTIALSDAGAAVQQYQYDAYGQSTNTFTEVGPGSASYAYRYTGQRLDGGTGLYDYKARSYSQILGRFLQPDPTGLDQGPNLYEYVGNNPLGAVDPSGECLGMTCAGAGGAGGGDITMDAILESEARQMLANQASWLAQDSANNPEAVTRSQNAARANPAFGPSGGVTHCNQALCSIARQAGAPTRDFLDRHGNPLSANAIAQNLIHSADYHEVSPSEAQAIADRGQLAIFAYENAKGHGHVGTVRAAGIPGDPKTGGSGPLLNNIGATIAIERASRVFRAGRQVRYYAPNP
jgi:RHS repeat-associated protein